MALAAAIDLAQTPDAAPIIIAALATDGTDGPTDAAGGLADAFRSRAAKPRA
jgi:glycerate-2-kinase